jgi:phospholipase/carboxylesterase
MKAAGIVALLSLLTSCRSVPSEPSEPSKPAPSGSPSAAELELQSVTVTDMPETEQGGTLVVLLHGYGAAGDDLVPFARQLLRAKARIVVPAAPLTAGTGRAWWSFEPAERPAHAWSDEPPANYRGSAQLVRARHALQHLLRDAQQRYRPERVALAGFSQGAMLSLDVALAADPPVARVVALSGVMLADSLAALKAPHAARPQFWLSHGRSDQVLPFAGGEAASKLLQKYGYDCSFRPFEGGHTIPRQALPEIARVLFD